MEHKNIAAKLIQVMKTCGYIQKDSENKEQKYKYVSAAAVLEKVNPALVEVNLISIPEFSVVSEKEKATSRGGIWQLVTVQLKLQLIDADSGETLTITSLGTGTDPGDKATSKAQTAALKYAWLTALNIETGDEPEADGRTDQQQFHNQPPPPPPAQNPYLPGSQLPQGAPPQAGNPRMQEIHYYWHALGWDSNMLLSYLEQRFRKPIDQVNDAEMQVVVNEAKDHLSQKRAERIG